MTPIIDPDAALAFLVFLVLLVGGAFVVEWFDGWGEGDE